jgi:ketosteroid isomerase-like protein
MKPLLILFVIGLLVSCAQQKSNLENEKQAIIKDWSDWGKKAEAGDPGYYWTNDVVLMGPGGPTIKGKEEFLKMFTAMTKNPGFKMSWDKEPSEIEVSEDGQMAYLFAKNQVTITDSTGAVKSGTNQALQIWKKDKEGNWKAAVSVMYPDEPMK